MPQELPYDIGEEMAMYKKTTALKEREEDRHAALSSPGPRDCTCQSHAHVAPSQALCGGSAMAGGSLVSEV